MLQGLKALPKGLSMRPARPVDAAFVRKLVDDRYTDLKSHPNLSRDQYEHLMEMQVIAQSNGYGSAYPNAIYLVIEKNGQRIGSLTLDWEGGSAHVVSLGFVKKAQGKGYGQVVVHALKEACVQSKCPLSVTCWTQNLGLMTYLKMNGFKAEPAEPDAAQIRLYWVPASGAPAREPATPA
ncbi:RimJ/RimL family protein N-acetyltransferase [Roseibium hamelinense]|uniref:RimJ/RimL family protein N-acetyltransferase n=1 Tax=Roseibium hamelinense TaxID=150831 RepID=A0A562STU8_9HYPH|nr:GNAT family N-acetyltransferase [Roseibium hamelinense]MTI42409.1 N-acetyltransferase [Roseibium hamelinense]TWI84705.1 RimJ/RimL family protein N-acetyltransferase [Roseibium hamelinense]